MSGKHATTAKLQEIAARFKAPAAAAPVDAAGAAQVDQAMRSALERIARVVVPGSYIHKLCTHGLAGREYQPNTGGSTDGQ